IRESSATLAGTNFGLIGRRRPRTAAAGPRDPDSASRPRPAGARGPAPAPLPSASADRARAYSCQIGVLEVWRFCPRCREELELGGGRARCPWCGFVAYANSAPTANALVVDGEGRLLLVRRAIEPFKGRWDIPGGFLEEGEHPLDGIRRELREETGLDVEP